jgi:prepilin-type N-terminal cleavage/methylation domain-containing protein
MLRDGFLKSNGFTLLEMLVAISVFSVVIIVVVGLFVSGSSSQRKIIEMHSVQNEAAYLMEMMSRELRMASDISGQDNKQDSYIAFTNHQGSNLEYCRSDATGVCDASGKYLASNNQVVNSNKIEIVDLKFYTSEDFTVTRSPLITISMTVRSKGKYQSEITIQNSIVPRIY